MNNEYPAITLEEGIENLKAQYIKQMELAEIFTPKRKPRKKYPTNYTRPKNRSKKK